MLSVSICTYHTPFAQLDRCLASLCHPSVDRVVIVDNASDPAMARYAADHGAEYMALPNPGYGAAHNRVLLATQSPYHLVVNADVWFEPAVLDELLGVMERNPDVLQLQPRVLNADGSPQYASRRLPSPWILGARRFAPRLARRAEERYLLKDMDLTRPLDVPYQTGCFMLLRTEAARRAGGFDERFFMYPEDIDLSRRLFTVGRVVYYPGCSIVHDHAAESYGSLRMTRIHIVNMIRYFAKWFFSDLWGGSESRRRLNARISNIELRQESHLRVMSESAGSR